MLSTRRSGRDSLVQQVLLLEARVIPLSVVVSVQPLNTRYASPASEGDHPDACCCLLSYQVVRDAGVGLHRAGLEPAQALEPGGGEGADADGAPAPRWGDPELQTRQVQASSAWPTSNAGSSRSVRAPARHGAPIAANEP